MTYVFTDFIRGMFLAAAIGFGGYVWGTPGSQPLSAGVAGALAVIFVQSGRWFEQ